MLNSLSKLESKIENEDILDDLLHLRRSLITIMKDSSNFCSALSLEKQDLKTGNSKLHNKGTIKHQLELFNEQSFMFLRIASKLLSCCSDSLVFFENEILDIINMLSYLENVQQVLFDLISHKNYNELVFSLEQVSISFLIFCFKPNDTLYFNLKNDFWSYKNFRFWDQNNLIKYFSISLISQINENNINSVIDGFIDDFERKLNQIILTKKEGKLDGKVESNLDGKVEGNLGGKVESNLGGKVESNLEVQLEGNSEVQLESNLEAQLEGNSDYNLDNNLSCKVDGKVDGKLGDNLEEELNIIYEDINLIQLPVNTLFKGKELDEKQRKLNNLEQLYFSISNPVKDTNERSWITSLIFFLIFFLAATILIASMVWIFVKYAFGV